jgi:hypothetical protein
MTNYNTEDTQNCRWEAGFVSSVQRKPFIWGKPKQAPLLGKRGKPVSNILRQEPNCINSG